MPKFVLRNTSINIYFALASLKDRIFFKIDFGDNTNLDLNQTGLSTVMKTYDKTGFYELKFFAKNILTDTHFCYQYKEKITGLFFIMRNLTVNKNGLNIEYSIFQPW